MNAKLQAAALRRQLVEKGYGVAMFPPEPGRTQAWAVNVYRAPGDRYPADTVWVDHAEWVWGPNFEHHAPYGATITEVAAKVIETIGEATT